MANDSTKLQTKKAIHKVTNVLDLIKGVNTGYTTSNSTQFLLSVDGTVYRTTLEPVAKGNVDFDLIDMYLK